MTSVRNPMPAFKKTAIAACVAVLGLPLAAQANPLTINMGGFGTATNVTQFDWAPSPVISIEGNTAFQNFIGTSGACPAGSCQFDVYSHGRLNAFNNDAGTPGGLNQAGGWEITYEIGFQESVTAASINGGTGQSSANFGFVTGAPNYFRMWYDNFDSDYLAGTGFTDGTLMLAGTVSPSGAFISNFGGDFTDIALLDQYGADGWGGKQSIGGSGTTSTMALDVLPVDITPGVFPGTIAFDLFRIANLGQSLQFETVDPSKSFNWDSTGSGATVGTRIVLDSNNRTTGGGGSINGQNGTDTLFQSDANSPVSGIPEPTTLALIGLGILGAAAARRRKV